MGRQQVALSLLPRWRIPKLACHNRALGPTSGFLDSHLNTAGLHRTEALSAEIQIFPWQRSLKLTRRHGHPLEHGAAWALLQFVRQASEDCSVQVRNYRRFAHPPRAKSEVQVGGGSSTEEEDMEGISFSENRGV